MATVRCTNCGATYNKYFPLWTIDPTPYECKECKEDTLVWLTCYDTKELEAVTPAVIKRGVSQPRRPAPKSKPRPLAPTDTNDAKDEEQKVTGISKPPPKSLARTYDAEDGTRRRKILNDKIGEVKAPLDSLATVDQFSAVAPNTFDSTPCPLTNWPCLAQRRNYKGRWGVRHASWGCTVEIRPGIGVDLMCSDQKTLEDSVTPRRESKEANIHLGFLSMIDKAFTEIENTVIGTSLVGEFNTIDLCNKFAKIEDDHYSGITVAIELSKTLSKTTISSGFELRNSAKVKSLTGLWAEGIVSQSGLLQEIVKEGGSEAKLDKVTKVDSNKMTLGTTNKAESFKLVRKGQDWQLMQQKTESTQTRPSIETKYFAGRDANGEYSTGADREKRNAIPIIRIPFPGTSVVSFCDNEGKLAGHMTLKGITKHIDFTDYSIPVHLVLFHELCHAFVDQSGLFGFLVSRSKIGAVGGSKEDSAAMEELFVCGLGQAIRCKYNENRYRTEAREKVLRTKYISVGLGTKTKDHTTSKEIEQALRRDVEHTSVILRKLGFKDINLERYHPSNWPAQSKTNDLEEKRKKVSTEREKGSFYFC